MDNEIAFALLRDSSTTYQVVTSWKSLESCVWGEIIGPLWNRYFQDLGSDWRTNAMDEDVTMSDIEEFEAWKTSWCVSKSEDEKLVWLGFGYDYDDPDLHASETHGWLPVLLGQVDGIRPGLWMDCQELVGSKSNQAAINDAQKRLVKSGLDEAFQKAGFTLHKPSKSKWGTSLIYSKPFILEAKDVVTEQDVWEKWSLEDRIQEILMKLFEESLVPLIGKIDRCVGKIGPRKSS